MWWESPPSSTQWKPDCWTCRETRAALCTQRCVENQPSGGPIGLEGDMPTRHCPDDPRPRAEWPADLLAPALPRGAAPLVLTQAQWAARVPSSAHKDPLLWARQPPSVSMWMSVRNVLLADSELVRLTYRGDIARVAVPPGRPQSLPSCQDQGGKGPPNTQLSEVDAGRWDGLTAQGKMNLLMLMGWLLWSTWMLGAFRVLESQTWRARQGEGRWCLRRGNSRQWNQEQRWGLWSSPNSATTTHRVHWLLWPRDPFGGWVWAWVLEPNSPGPHPGADACQQAEPGEWLQHRVAGFDPLSILDMENDIPCEGVVVIGWVGCSEQQAPVKGWEWSWWLGDVSLGLWGLRPWHCYHSIWLPQRGPQTGQLKQQAFVVSVLEAGDQIIGRAASFWGFSP